MPGQRGKGQKQVIVLMKEDFLNQIDGNLEAMGFGDRAAFIRTAVLEKLARAGVDVPKLLATPPPRAGKGGRPKKAAPDEEKKAPTETEKPPTKHQPRKKQRS